MRSEWEGSALQQWGEWKNIWGVEIRCEFLVLRNNVMKIVNGARGGHWEEKIWTSRMGNMMSEKEAWSKKQRKDIDNYRKD